ncbi:MAG TPA: hypothetical protein VKC17_12680 [Sphingomicrobium sp.]|jgi:hypothetical protein|nr:hypothetical protein [Sphingomicrobium sp.]
MTNDTKGKRKGKAQGGDRSATDELAAGLEGIPAGLTGSPDDRRSFIGSPDDR